MSIEHVIRSGGRKLSRRRMRKKLAKSHRAFADCVLGQGVYAKHMRSLGHWKADGPRKPLWRAT